MLDDFSDRVAPGIAELLAAQGKDVEIITGRSSITDPNLGMWTDAAFMLPKLDELGVKITPYTWVKEITDRGATCFYGPSGREYDVEADNIIMVTTKYSNIELLSLFKARKIDCRPVGDARAPRWILNAVRDGYKVAREI